MFAGFDGDEWVADVQATRETSPFGMLKASEGAFGVDYGFTGEPLDDNGMYFLRNRQYNPTLGVFPNLDPVEGIPTRPMSLNRYLYVFANPINFIDPLGLNGIGIACRQIATNTPFPYDDVICPLLDLLENAEEVGRFLQESLNALSAGTTMAGTFSLPGLPEIWREQLSSPRPALSPTDLDALQARIAAEVDMVCSGVTPDRRASCEENYYGVYEQSYGVRLRPRLIGEGDVAAPPETMPQIPSWGSEYLRRIAAALGRGLCGAALRQILSQITQSASNMDTGVTEATEAEESNVLTLYHYTFASRIPAIRDSGYLWPSIRDEGDPRTDAQHGDGQ